MNQSSWSPWALVATLLGGSCMEPESEGDDGPTACVGGQFCVEPLVCVDGFCVEPMAETGDTPGDGDGDPPGDGDGDPPGDGDGDPPGDGDGDPPGDGDGDPPGDGDGDGDPPGDGDGDGDPLPTCGNGIVDPGEDCDGALEEDCISLGYPMGGGLACEDCQYIINCDPCGDGTLDPGEECDGNNLGGATCASEGFGSGGALSCQVNSCYFDPSGCCDGVGDPCNMFFVTCCPGLTCTGFNGMTTVCE